MLHNFCLVWVVIYEKLIRFYSLSSARDSGGLHDGAVHLFVCLLICHMKCLHKNAIFLKTKQLKAMICIDDQ